MKLKTLNRCLGWFGLQLVVVVDTCQTCIEGKPHLCEGEPTMLIFRRLLPR